MLLYQASANYFQTFPEDSQRVSFSEKNIEILQHGVTADLVIDTVRKLNAMIIKSGYTSIRVKFCVFAGLVQIVFLGLLIFLVEVVGIVWHLIFAFILIALLNYGILWALTETRKRAVQGITDFARSITEELCSNGVIVTILEFENVRKLTLRITYKPRWRLRDSLSNLQKKNPSYGTLENSVRNQVEGVVRTSPLKSTPIGRKLRHSMDEEVGLLF
jgi:hypothetical protein